MSRLSRQRNIRGYTHIGQATSLGTPTLRERKGQENELDTLLTVQERKGQGKELDALLTAQERNGQENELDTWLTVQERKGETELDILLTV